VGDQGPETYRGQRGEINLQPTFSHLADFYSFQIPIATSNVLLLSDLSRFTTGTTLVREHQNLHLDIFRSYTSAKDTAGAIRALNKYGPEEPQLYSAALAYFVSSPQILAEAGDEFDKMLRRIDEEGLMAPLQVIQTLSGNAVATMGLVKRYLMESIGREREEISAVSFFLFFFVVSVLSFHETVQLIPFATEPSHNLNLPCRHRRQTRRAGRSSN